MKKFSNILLMIVILSFILISLSSCGNKNEVGKSKSNDLLNTSNTDNNENYSTNGSDTSDVVHVTEKMFVTYVDEIYTNAEDYLGRLIKIEGMFMESEYKGNPYFYVYRIGPDCCSTGGSICGFEFTYDGDMPHEDDWIEVLGFLSDYNEDGYTFLKIDAKTVTVMDTRGTETVFQ